MLRKREVAGKPALIVWGVDDQVFSVAGAQRLHQRIAGRVRTLPNSGHMLHVESAREVAPIYLDFLRSRK